MKKNLTLYQTAPPPIRSDFFHKVGILALRRPGAAVTLSFPGLKYHPFSDGAPPEGASPALATCGTSRLVYSFPRWTL
jgi:hypothetical protein